MYKNIISNLNNEESPKSNFIGFYKDSFIKWLQTKGYSWWTIHARVQQLTHFEQYCLKRGKCSINKALRGRVWVISYLFKHTSQYFKPYVFLITKTISSSL